MAPLSSIIDDLADIATEIGVLGEQRTRTWETTHDPDTASNLDVATKNGAITVHPSDGTDLVIQATAKTRHEDDDLESVTLDLELDGDTIRVEPVVPAANDGTMVDLDVGVPASLAVDRVATKNGKIEVRDVHGDALLESKNGKLVVESVAGTVSARAKNGAITIRDTPVDEVATKNGKTEVVLSDIADDVTVQTKNGTIDVAVPADVDADFILDTERGSVSVEGLTHLADESSRSHVAGELGAGGLRIEATAKNGTITLRAR